MLFTDCLQNQMVMEKPGRGSLAPKVKCLSGRRKGRLWNKQFRFFRKRKKNKGSHVGFSGPMCVCQHTFSLRHRANESRQLGGFFPAGDGPHGYFAGDCAEACFIWPQFLAKSIQRKLCHHPPT